ncbi:uncharacterized protein LOC143895370 [Temnothorax americanus]|uniref:uncharacterized protein LOC143895370 n=1 Tax=Temnothorax americanus TaxID=1964332 RepID=UPI00406867D0
MEESDYYVCGMCGKVMEGERCSECPILEDEDEISFEELLISEVSRRRELWDPTIELKLRTPAITAKSWAAIDEALGILPGTAKNAGRRCVTSMHANWQRKKSMFHQGVVLLRRRL